MAVMPLFPKVVSNGAELGRIRVVGDHFSENRWRP